MAKVKVRYFGEPRELLNAKEEEYEVKDGATLADLILCYIPERHKEASRIWRETLFRIVGGQIATNKDGTPLLKNYLILIRGRSQDLNYAIKDGEEAILLPPSGGG